MVAPGNADTLVRFTVHVCMKGVDSANRGQNMRDEAVLCSECMGVPDWPFPVIDPEVMNKTVNSH